MSSTYDNIKVFLDTTDTAKNSLIHKISNSHYLFTLPVPVVLNQNDKHCLQVAIESITVPLSIYTVNRTNCNLYINNEVIEIAHGNYNIDTFIFHVNALLLPHDLKCSYEDSNSKITFTSINTASSVTFPPQITGSNSAHRLFGITFGSKSLPYRCESGIALYYTTGIGVQINNLVNYNQSINGGANNILRLPITTSPFTVLSHYSSTPFMTTINNKVINFLDISLVDDYGNPLEIQEIPWFVVIRINYILKDEYRIDETLHSQILNKKI